MCLYHNKISYKFTLSFINILFKNQAYWMPIVSIFTNLYILYHKDGKSRMWNIHILKQNTRNYNKSIYLIFIHCYDAIKFAGCVPRRSVSSIPYINIRTVFHYAEDLHIRLPYPQSFCQELAEFIVVTLPRQVIGHLHKILCCNSC